MIFASGFLSGDDPAFEPWVALDNGGTFPLSARTTPPPPPPPASTARLQVIHNSPTPTVDVYANDALLLDNFVYRTATPFIDVPAGVQINLGVATSDSQSSADAIANFPVTLEEGKTYVVVANGIVGGNPGFNLEIFDMGSETADSPDNIGILFFHGSPDAPTVDIVTGGNVLIDDASYGDFAGYLNVPATSYDLDVTPGNDNSTIVASYTADLSFWRGRTAVIFASGFLSGDDPAFEPWVALDNGGTFPLRARTTPPPPPPPAATARLQVIHNSPTPTVDIYANTNLLLNDFEFRTATPFIDVPAGVLIDLGIATADSQSSMDAIANFPVTLEEGKTYVVVASGIVGGNPGFNLEIFDMGSETADSPDNVGILFYHGSPDAPTVDITTGGAVLIDDASYGDFAGYLNVPAISYDLDVTPGNDNSTIVASYTADLSGLAGGAAVVFASGFLSGNTPAFEPWVALTDGTTFALPVRTTPPPPMPMARVQVIHNSPSPTVDIYANDARLLDDFEFRTATPFIDVPAGVLIDLGIATADSQSSMDAIANFPVTLEEGKTYVVVASGIVGGNPGFNLEIFDMGSETADSPDNVGILFYHGSPDAPTVDITTGGNVLIDNASYGDFAGYLNVPAASYDLDITPGDDNSTIVASYTADVSGLGGGAAVIFASGFLSGDTPAFEPWVALTDGTTFALPVRMRRSAPSINTRSNVQVNEWLTFPNPTSDNLTIKTNLKEEGNLTVEMYSLMGQLISRKDFGQQSAGYFEGNFNFSAANGSYTLRIVQDERVINKTIQVLK